MSRQAIHRLTDPFYFNHSGASIEWLRCWDWECRYRLPGGLKVERDPISNNKIPYWE